MKITNRMKKILLFLLRPEKTYQWFNKENISISKQDYYHDWQIMSFCTRGKWWKSSRIKELSYRRTFKILRKLGLIEKLKMPIYEYPSYKLTDKGKKLAEKIEKDVREFIKDYGYLA